MAADEPLVYLEIQHYRDTWEPYVSGIGCIENYEEFKSTVANTGHPPSTFSITEFPVAKIFALTISLCKQEFNLQALKEYGFGFLTADELLRFMDRVLPERIMPIICKEPTPAVVEMYAGLTKQYPVLVPMLRILGQVGNRWELSVDQDDSE